MCELLRVKTKKGSHLLFAKLPMSLTPPAGLFHHLILTSLKFMLLYMHILYTGRHRKPQLVLPQCHVWKFHPPTRFLYKRLDTVLKVA